MLVEAGCESLDVAQCHLTTQSPAGTLARSGSVASSAYVSTLPSSAGIAAFVQTVDDLIQTLPHLGGGLVFDAYRRRHQRRRSRRDTAFVHRDAIAGIQASVATGRRARRGDAGPVVVGRTSPRRCRPRVDGQAYQNYIDPTLVDWQQAYYGANLGRLVSVKAQLRPRRRLPLRPVHPHPLGAAG